MPTYWEFDKDCYVGKSVVEFWAECRFQSYDAPFWQYSIWSFIACFAAVGFGFMIVEPCFKKTWHHLGHQDRLQWVCKGVSYIHALVAGLWALYVLVAEPEVPSDVAWGNSLNAQKVMGVAYGYMWFDLFTYLFRTDGNLAMIAHHAIAALALWYCSGTRLGISTTMGILVTELTTPFVQNRWYLEKLNLKESKWYSLNGLALWILWLPVRIGLCLFLCYCIMDQRPEWKHLPPYIVVTTVFPILFLSLNLYWYGLITQGVLAKLKGGKGKKRSAAHKSEKVDHSATQEQEKSNVDSKPQDGSQVRRRAQTTPAKD